MSLRTQVSYASELEEKIKKLKKQIKELKNKNTWLKEAVEYRDDIIDMYERKEERKSDRLEK